MEIGGNTRGGSNDRKRRTWPIHSRHILIPGIHFRTTSSRAKQVMRSTIAMSKEIKDAIAKNDAAAVLEVMKGGDVNSVSRPKCDSALHVAAEFDAAVAAKALIGIGANVNLRDFSGRTPLIYAAQFNASKTIRVLIDDGLAPVDLPEQTTLNHGGSRSSGDTALHTAVKYGSVEAVKALLDAGANPNALNNDLRTALISVFHPIRGKSSLAKALAMMNLLLSAGGNPEIPSGGEFERVDAAAAAAAPVAGPPSVDYGDNVKTTGGFRVPLHYAAHEDSAEMVKMLIAHGATATQRDFFGELPINYAKPDSECHAMIAALGEQAVDAQRRYSQFVSYTISS